MKRILTIITLFFVSSLFLLAQVPQKLSYQAVIRSAAGTLVTEEYLEVEISILQQSENGSTISPPIYRNTYRKDNKQRHHQLGNRHRQDS